MSRSRRKNPIIGCTTAKSEKKDKIAANRKLRRISKVKVKMGEDPPTLRDISDVWNFNKDGKQFVAQSIRLDQPKLMRK